MLCRVANELFWMARHIERAENTARMLDVTYRTSLLPYQVTEQRFEWAEPWAVPLITSGLATGYYERYPVLSAESVLKYMILDSTNTSSVYCCLRAARESARSVRGAITSEMYEDLNTAWLEMRRYDYDTIQQMGVSDFLEWVKMRSHLFRGVTFGTMLRDEAYHFIRLGTHLERADNTARILDVKYHLLLPSTQDVGGAVDYYQWAAVLQSVSGFESYRKIYSDVITPRRVAELLVLRADMPRSLHCCMNFIHETIQRLCEDHRNSAELERSSGQLHALLHYGRTDDIIELGLHEYLMEFVERISALGEEISRVFLAPSY
jgi:uncharacterized alpha-E superfamily protein